VSPKNSGGENPFNSKRTFSASEDFSKRIDLNKGTEEKLCPWRPIAIPNTQRSNKMQAKVLTLWSF
jgi:hypothetical protein